MGFLSTFFSDMQCGYCKSYDMTKVQRDSNEWTKVVNSIYGGGYEGIVKNLHRCNDCGQYSWEGVDRSKWHTTN